MIAHGEPKGPRLAGPPGDGKERALRVLSELPPFSPILNRVMATLADDNVSFIELGDLIEKDAVLSGQILQLANSAMYARRNQVASVRYALSLLGVAKTRNIVLGVQVAGMWSKARSPQELSVSRFNMHSAAVAILSDLLAQYVPSSFGEGAFVAGLLHDVGRLLMALGLPVEFAEVVRTHRETGVPMVECEQAALSFTHAELSEEVLERWKLPVAVQTAVARHHSPTPLGQGHPAEIPLSHLVAAADRYVNSIGMPILEAKPAEPDLESIEGLGLARPRVEQLLADFQRDFEATAQFFR